MSAGGDDAYYGGDGRRDRLDAPLPASRSVVFDLSTGRLEGDEIGSDSARGFEGAAGTRFDDTLIGNAANNALYGSIGDDHIEGRDGNDRLFGDSGFDFLDGGGGTDECSGGETVMNCELFPPGRAALIRDRRG